MILWLRAKSVTEEFVEFNVLSVPKYYNNELFFLSTKPGTPLLYIDSIEYGSDIVMLDGRRIFSGDVLYDIEKKEKLFVTYSSGFSLVGEDEILRSFDTLTKFEYLGHYTNEESVPNTAMSRYNKFKARGIVFKYESEDGPLIFNLFDTVITMGSDLYINKESYRGPLKKNRIKQTSMCKKKGTGKVYFGDEYNGYHAILKKGGIYLVNGYDSILIQNTRKINKIWENVNNDVI